MIHTGLIELVRWDSGTDDVSVFLAIRGEEFPVSVERLIELGEVARALDAALRSSAFSEGEASQ